MEYASKTEKTIATKLVERLLDAGLKVGVFDGEEHTVDPTTDKAKILGALCTTDYDNLMVDDADGNTVGAIVLIWGNEEDLISDYTDTPILRDLLDEWFI